MSLIAYSTVLIVGVLVGAGGFYAAVGSIDSLAMAMMKMAFKSQDAWILVQRGNSYDLTPVEYEKSVNAYKSEADDDEVEWFEDDGMMHSLWKVPFGIAHEDHTAVVDPVTAEIASAEIDKDDTGDKLRGDEEFALDELRSRLHVGTLERQSEGFKHRIDIINPFVTVEGAETEVREETTTTTRHHTITDGGEPADSNSQTQDQSLLQRLGLRSVDESDSQDPPTLDELADERAEAEPDEITTQIDEEVETVVERETRMDIIDVRDITSVLSHAGSPDTPRKTAENAAQAERAFDDWGELKRNASLIAAFVIGAIMMYIGMSNGGGGGGGGVSIMLDSVAMVSGVLF
jgi:hypothetical protein